jgi:hypothetical protein
MLKKVVAYHQNRTKSNILIKENRIMDSGKPGHLNYFIRDVFSGIFKVPGLASVPRATILVQPGLQWRVSRTVNAFIHCPLTESRGAVTGTALLSTGAFPV